MSTPARIPDPNDPAEVPLPPELAVAVEPFTDEDLDAALAYLDNGAEVETLRGMSPDDVEEHGPAPLRRTAGFRVDEVTAARYGITVDEVAEWAGRKFTGAKVHEDTAKAQAKAWRARIDEWERAQVAQAKARREFFEAVLAEYGLDRRAANPKANKTTTLPSAVVATTAQNVGGRVDVDVEEQVIAWAEEVLPGDVFDQVVRTTSAVVLGPFRDQVELVRLVVLAPDEEDDEPSIEVLDAAGERLTVDPAIGEWFDALDPRPQPGDEVPLVVYPAHDVDAVRHLVPGVVIEPESVAVKVKPR